METTWIWAKKTFEFPISAEKSLSILVKTLFLFFFKTTSIWAKKTFKFSTSAEKSLSILVKTSEFLRFCASNPPQQNFLDPPLTWGSKFRTNTLNFTRVIYLNWLERLNWGDLGLLVVNAIVNYCWTRVLFYSKMLKETETEETIGFLSRFWHWWHFNWGKRAPSPSSGYAYASKLRGRADSLEPPRSTSVMPRTMQKSIISICIESDS